MKVESKKLDAAKMQLYIEVPQDTVKKKFDEVYGRLGKEAKIPGFRPGNAPRDILEKYHGSLAREEVIKNLIPDAYKDSIEKEKIAAIELPEISEVRLESNVLSFKAVVEIRPEIEVKDYKNLKLKYRKAAVSPDEIEKTLNELKSARKVEAIDEKFARGLGYRTTDEMRSSIERQLFLQKENDLRYHLQDDLLKQVLGKVSFNIPVSLVRRRLEELVRDARAQMGLRGATSEQISSKEGDLRKELYPQAEIQVKTFLVLEEIAEKEKIPESEHLTQDVIEFLLREANWVEE